MATVIQAQDKSKMKYILDYVHDPEKTRSELQGGTLLMNPENAYDEFMLTKQLWGKDQEGKRMCMHYIQSFKPGEVTPELAKQIADEFVKQKNFQGFQISYAVHTDKDHIHTHFILNTVNVEDGHKWQLADLKILRRVSDRLCKKHGLSILPEKEVAKSKSPAQRDAERKGTSWKKETQMAVDAALEVAENHTEFFWLMNKQGYQVRWKNEYKYVLFTNPDGKKMRNRIFENPGNYTRTTSYGAAKYVKKIDYDKETGEILTASSGLDIDEDKIREEESLDGYYMLLTSEMETSDDEIIDMYRGLWRIEESFKVTKSELEARPVYVWPKEHIEAHFLTCFVALIIARILENKLERKYSIGTILESLSKAKCSLIQQNYYLFDYYDEVLKDIGRVTDIDFGKRIRTLGEIKKVLAKTKK